MRTAVLALSVAIGCATPKPGVVGAIVVANGTVIDEQALPEATDVALRAASQRCREPADLLAVANREGGASWKLEPVLVDVIATPPDPAALDQMEAEYLAGNFDECHARSLTAAMQPQAFLAHGKREAAARAVILSAACAVGAKYLQRAAEILDAALVKRGLDFAPSLQVTPPPFQTLFATRRSLAVQRDTVHLAVEITPATSRVFVDGEPVTCVDGTCDVAVTAGEHVVVAESFGYRRWVETILAPQRLTHALAQSWLDGSTQLAAALHGIPLPGASRPRVGCGDGRSAGRRTPLAVAPTELEIGARASAMFHAPIALVINKHDSAARAFVYDQRSGRIVASREVVGADATPRAATLTIRDWRTRAEHIPWYKRWRVWAVAGAAAAVATGVTVYLATSVRDDLVFEATPP